MCYRYSVKFEVSQGLISNNIWASQDESVANLNIKRGILSALQLEKTLPYNEVVVTKQVGILLLLYTSTY